nr:substrate-binding domain-containing protein [Rahnella aquatilis]
MVRAGDGIAWLPETLAAPDVDAGSIAVAAKKDSALWIPIESDFSDPQQGCPGQ